MLLKLKDKDWKIIVLNLKETYKKILICPQSTDDERSIKKNK